jgi:hypothetical protein
MPGRITGAGGAALSFPDNDFMRHDTVSAKQLCDSSWSGDNIARNYQFSYLHVVYIFIIGNLDETNTISLAQLAFRVVRLVGMAYCHKASQKSYSELGSRKGWSSPQATGSGTEKSYRPRTKASACSARS